MVGSYLNGIVCGIYGKGNVGKFLEHEIDGYLKGRKSETYKVALNS